MRTLEEALKVVLESGATLGSESVKLIEAVGRANMKERGETMATESCCNCVYAYWDRCQAMLSFSTGFPSRPACANHPESLGRMRPVALGEVCRNYRPKPPEPTGDVKRIPLGDGLYAYVDAADYDWLSQWTWSSVNGYAARNEKGKLVYMHRQIMNAPPGKIVDHHNHNKLDNTRANLRLCTGPQNQRNQRKKRGSLSKFKGVGYSKDRHKWYAQIKMMGKDIWLGYHPTEVEAARAYDRKAVELFREFANLNFPEEWPPDRREVLYAESDAGETKAKKDRRGESSFARKPAARQRTKGKKAGKKDGPKAGMKDRRGESSSARPPAATAKKPKGTKEHTHRGTRGHRDKGR